MNIQNPAYELTRDETFDVTVSGTCSPTPFNPPDTTITSVTWQFKDLTGGTAAVTSAAIPYCS